MFPSADKRGSLFRREEIDALLSGLNSGLSRALGAIATQGPPPEAEASEPFTPKSLAVFLQTRREPEDLFGIHTGKAQYSSVFTDREGMKYLERIRKRNKEQRRGNTRVADTGIELINYSVCPSCRLVLSFTELEEYYRRPEKVRKIEKVPSIVRRYMDTRVCCPMCKTFYLPTVVIYNEAPRNAKQYLSRLQAMHFAEEYFLKAGRKVLSRNPDNFRPSKPRGKPAVEVRDDLDARLLTGSPTLLVNLLQHMPIREMTQFITGKNLEMDIPLFGGHKFAAGK